MGWRNYGELEPKESLLAEFLIAFAWGVMSVYGYGWIFVRPGWLTGANLSMIALGTGLLFGLYFGWCFLHPPKYERPPFCDESTLLRMECLINTKEDNHDAG